MHEVPLTCIRTISPYDAARITTALEHLHEENQEMRNSESAISGRIAAERQPRTDPDPHT